MLLVAAGREWWSFLAGILRFKMREPASLFRVIVVVGLYTLDVVWRTWCSRHLSSELQARIMDQLAEMRVFVRAIERDTFAVAARDLGLTPSAVSKLIRRLETRLGVRLVNRTTRKLALTAEGKTYFHSGRQLIEEIDGLEHEVSASAGHPRGLLRINTTVSFGVQHLAPALMEFQRRYPDVRVSISLTDRPVDLHAQQIDVAVRVGPLSDSSLMSRKVGEVGRVICASPQYLKQFGTPKSRDDLAQHRCIVFTAPGRSRWAFRNTRWWNRARGCIWCFHQRQSGMCLAARIARCGHRAAGRFHGC